MNSINIPKLPGAGPFYYQGNKIGILMIHGGGGGSCADLKPLAEDLNKKGNYTIHIPLLPGFGTNPEDLRRVTVDTWKRALTKEFQTLKEKCDFIFIGGHSMGGVLALILAHKFEVDGIFTISAPIGIRGIGIKLVPILNMFINYHRINSNKLREDTNGKWVGYDKIPLNIINKFKSLLKEMKNLLPEVGNPIILFQGMKDMQIKKDSINKIYNLVSSLKKKKVWLENNQHPILDCPDHMQIVEELNKFIKDFTNSH